MTMWTFLPCKHVQVGGQVADDGLAFAGPHFGDLAFVEHPPADELAVEVAVVLGPARGLAQDGEAFLTSRPRDPAPR